MRLLFLALRNLRRGGQRVVLATACVAFGVMSLVALQLLSGTLNQSIGVDPRCVVGGDLGLTRNEGRLTSADVADLTRWQEEGRLSRVALVKETPGGLVRRRGDGRVHFLHRVLAIDPSSYPLVGELRLAGDSSIESALSMEAAALVTSDVAERLEVTEGDEITVAAGPSDLPQTFIVKGIVVGTPDQRGGTILRSFAPEELPSTAYVLLGTDPPTLESLETRFSVARTEEIMAQRQSVAGLFDFMLKGAAMLGLMLAGIGIANTMQVLLARRRVEIATLKALGFERKHLVQILGLEATVIGLLGGIVGAPFGVALSVWLATLLGRMGPMLLTPSLDSLVIVGSIAVGVIVATLFAMHAIVKASDVRPAVLLRDQPTPRVWKESAIMVLLLCAAFSTLASLVLGSVLKGLLVTAGGVIGLVALASLLGGALAIALRVPVPLPAMVQLARYSLRRRATRALVALVALFCGVFSIGFAGSVISNAAARFEQRALPGDGLNLAVHAKLGDRAMVEDCYERNGLRDYGVIATASISTFASDGSPVPGIRGVSSMPRSLELVRIEESHRTSASVLAPARLRESIKVGDELVLRGSGSETRVAVSGYYEPTATTPLVPRPSGLIVDEAIVEAVSLDSASATFLSQVDPDRQRDIAGALGRELPDAMVLTRRDLNSVMQGVMENLFAFVIAVAGLALVAGAVLIANSVGLAMIERQKETAIFRALGYSAARVLGGLAIEYSLLGAVAGMFGMAAVAVAFFAINTYQPQAKLTLDPVQACLLMVASTGIALASAVTMAWRPIHARPLATLRRE